jgi:uncharacterized protein YkwD
MNQRRPSGRALPRLLAVAVLAAAMSTAIGPVANPGPASAATTLSPTTDSIEATLLSWINDARAQRGLRPLRTWGRLASLADDWAAHMASTDVLAFPSCLSCMYSDYGIQKYSYGAIISWSTYNWGLEAAQSIWNGWRQHDTQWAKLMSSKFNYIGIGIFYRSSNKKTWSSVDLSESKDHTKPWARMTGSSRSGTTVSWSWTGGDTKLQTHTAGLKNFDVQYRRDSGSWTTIRSGTTAKSLSLSGRAHGHWYGVRVRSRDNRGYVSAWTAEVRIWVP